MQQITVINNGVRFRVNVPSWEDGIGAGAPEGTLWMKSDDGIWYAITATSTSPTAAISVNQTPIGWEDNSLGYQLLAADNGNTYAVYLTGVPNSVTFTVSQSAYSGSSQPKPYLLLQSTDGNYYRVFLADNAGTIEAEVDQSMVSGSWLHPIY